jgi:hypothetical protein
MTKAVKAIAGASVILGLTLPTNVLAKDDLQSQVDQLGKQLAALQKELDSVNSAKKSNVSENFVDSKGSNSYQSAAVTTSPTLGLRSAHHGQDLVVNFSSQNEDLRLLEQREKYQKQRNIDELSRPLIELSGVLRGDILYSKAFDGSRNTDLDLEQAEIDMFVEASRWISGFMSIAYDNGSPSYDVSAMNVGSGYNDVSWSNIYLKRGFITVGDLSKSPVYGSIGQMYMPFGKYSSWLVSSSLTKKLGKTSGRAIDLGYAKNDFVATAYAMHGDSKKVNQDSSASTNTDDINAWGVNVEKKLDLAKNTKATVGAGYISNLADSEGILSTLEYASTLSALEGSASTLSYNVDQYVPAYDVYAKLELPSDWIISAEYIAAQKDIISAGLSAPFNDLGEPKALHVEIDKLAYLGPLPLAIGLGYGKTKDFVYFPEESYQLAVSTYLWKDTVQSLEYRHLKAYDGQESSAKFSENYITAMFSMYF